MAKGKRGGGNRGSRGAGTRGRTFRVIGTKKKRVGRPRKVRRPLTTGFVGVPPELRINAVEPATEIEAEEVAGDVDDVAEIEKRERAEGRTEESESK